MKTTLKKPVAIIGYSGHAYVIIDILLSAGRLVTAYCDGEEKERNPYHLQYLGKESEVINKLKKYDVFACIGHNGIREKVHQQMCNLLRDPINAIHPSAVISSSVKMSNGIMIAANATIKAARAACPARPRRAAQMIDISCPPSRRSRKAAPAFSQAQLCWIFFFTAA